MDISFGRCGGHQVFTPQPSLFHPVCPTESLIPTVYRLDPMDTLRLVHLIGETWNLYFVLITIIDGVCTRNYFITNVSRTVYDESVTIDDRNNRITSDNNVI